MNEDNISDKIKQAAGLITLQNACVRANTTWSFLGMSVSDLIRDAVIECEDEIVTVQVGDSDPIFITVKDLYIMLEELL